MVWQQWWLDGYTATFPEWLKLLALAKGAGYKAQAVRWPSNVLPLFLPPIVQNSIQWHGSDVTSKPNWLIGEAIGEEGF